MKGDRGREVIDRFAIWGVVVFYYRKQELGIQRLSCWAQKGYLHGVSIACLIDKLAI